MSGPRIDARTWEYVTALTRWVNEHSGIGADQADMKLAKVGEEVGEAIEAYIGMRGHNHRKGVTHSRHDVAAELFDTALTALVSADAFTGGVRREFDGYCARWDDDPSGAISPRTIRPVMRVAVKAGDAMRVYLAGGGADRVVEALFDTTLTALAVADVFNGGTFAGHVDKVARRAGVA